MLPSVKRVQLERRRRNSLLTLKRYSTKIFTQICLFFVIIITVRAKDYLRHYYKLSNGCKGLYNKNWLTIFQILIINVVLNPFQRHNNNCVLSHVSSSGNLKDAGRFQSVISSVTLHVLVIISQYVGTINYAKRIILSQYVLFSQSVS